MQLYLINYRVICIKVHIVLYVYIYYYIYIQFTNIVVYVHMCFNVRLDDKTLIPAI